ncbi:MAG: hypothetical protein ACI9EF_003467 [Pseudohongiellaceae bacterium]
MWGKIMLLQLIRVTVGVALLSAAATADVLVVHSDGSGDFTGLQAAVNAAASGDILLVQSDFTGEFVEVVGKGLTISGEVNQRPKQGGMQVSSVPAGEQIILRGLEFGPFPVANKQSLIVGGCKGVVLVEDCTATGNDGEPSFSGPFVNSCNVGESAVLTGANTYMIVTRCTFLGGTGHDRLASGPFVPSGPGGHGLFDKGGSTLAIYASSLMGGPGGSDPLAIGFGETGGSGLLSLGSFVWLEGGTAIGGPSGDGCFSGNILCNGGDAVVVSFGGSLQIRDAFTQGGLGGLYAIPDISGATHAPDGDDVYTDVGNLVAHPGAASHAIDLSPVYEGEPGTTSIVGPPAAFAGYVLSVELGHLQLGGSKGILAAGLPLFGPFLLGPIPANGVLEFSYTTPALGPLFEGFAFVKQALVTDTDGLRVTAPTAYVHLGAGP